MARQEISIYSQNVIGCLEFLMDYARFWYNKTHKPSCVFNKKEHQVYNKMHIGKWS